MTFSDNVASFPVCCPSRATFLTGQYAHNHHVMGNRAPAGGYRAFDEQETTMPVALQEAGYDTIHIGKYLNGYGRDSTEVPPGWTDFRGSIDPSTYLYFNFSLNVNGRTHTYGTRPSNYQTDVYARIAEDVITRHRRRGCAVLPQRRLPRTARRGPRGGGRGRIGACGACPPPRRPLRSRAAPRGRRRSTSPMSVTNRPSSRRGPASRPPSAAA